MGVSKVLRNIVCTVALSVVASVALTGCSQALTSDDMVTGATLAETKSPVQLLRNDAANRIPADVVDGSLGSQDRSVTCLSNENDPYGTIRRWQSGIAVALTPEAAADVDSVLADLAASYVDQGWMERDPGTKPYVDLYRESISTQVKLSVQPASDGTKAQVDIQVNGPCVTTGGGTSEEVTKLEKEEG
jgi:hypothetical protein